MTAKKPDITAKIKNLSQTLLALGVIFGIIFSMFAPKIDSYIDKRANTCIKSQIDTLIGDINVMKQDIKKTKDDTAFLRYMQLREYQDKPDELRDIMELYEKIKGK